MNCRPSESFLLWFLIFAWFCLPLPAQNTAPAEETLISDSQAFDVGLFETDRLLRVVLAFDITDYKRRKPVEEYLNARLTYYPGNGDSIIKAVQLKARGNFRRKFCDFPPIRLNFEIEDTTGNKFAGIDKLKLVPHCKVGFEPYILKEYLVYKLFNVLTAHSLRVRLLEIDYINTRKPDKPIIEYGFAIEPVNIFEKRTQSTEIETGTLTQKSIIPPLMDRVAIFNYMIGNTDWSVPNLHNVHVFSALEPAYPGKGILVPYDFDYSGIVNASYAVPFEELQIESVTERLFLGVCRNEEVYRQAIIEFAEKKEAFYQVIDDFPYLSEREKKRMTTYLDQFYVQLDKNGTIVQAFLKECKKF